MDNYLACFDTINEGRLTHPQKQDGFRVLFVKKPLFSDTYRIDQNLVTGPYMHNTDREFHRMMAKDFFCYNIVRKSELYDIVTGEFETLIADATEELDWDAFTKIREQIESGDYREQEKIEMFRKACTLPKEKREQKK